MTKLKPNREFVLRHLFVAVLMAVMSAWFAYDGYVKYPSMTPEALYESIEKSTAPDEATARKVAANAIHRQKEFALLALLAALAIGGHLLGTTRLDFAFDADGFTYSGRKYAWSDIAKTDERDWEKKQIMRLILNDGRRATLDAWHHNGVKEFRERLMTCQTRH